MGATFGLIANTVAAPIAAARELVITATIQASAAVAIANDAIEMATANAPER